MDDIYEALQSYQRLFQFRDPDNACLFGLKVNECYALDCIAVADGLTVSELAERLGVHKSNASRIASLLSDRGLVRQTVHDADQRSSELRATKKGEELHSQVKRYLVERFKRALSGVRPADIDGFLRVMTLLSDDARSRLSAARDPDPADA